MLQFAKIFVEDFVTCIYSKNSEKLKRLRIYIQSLPIIVDVPYEDLSLYFLKINLKFNKSISFQLRNVCPIPTSFVPFRKMFRFTGMKRNAYTFKRYWILFNITEKTLL